MDPSEIVIHPPFLNYLRPLTGAEKAKLEADVLEHGCRDPLVVWRREGVPLLVDGHTRREICDRHGLPYGVVEQHFDDEEAVLVWMHRHGGARRNHTRTEERYYLGARYNREKGKRGAPQGNTNRKSQTYHRDRVDDADCAERIAKEEGVGTATVTRAAKFAEQIDALDAHVGGGLKWSILAEMVAFTPKLYERLMRTEPTDVLAAIADARDAAKPTDKAKPLRAAAILAQLPEEPVPLIEAADDEPPEDDPLQVTELFCSNLMHLANRTHDTDKLESIVATLKSHALRIQAILNSRKGVS